jgi:hypothetical protein
MAVESKRNIVLSLEGMEGRDLKSGIERDDLLTLLAKVIEEQHKKITSGRVRDPKNEKLRLLMVKVLGARGSQDPPRHSSYILCGS